MSNIASCGKDFEVRNSIGWEPSPAYMVPKNWEYTDWDTDIDQYDGISRSMKHNITKTLKREEPDEKHGYSQVSPTCKGNPESFDPRGKAETIEQLETVDLSYDPVQNLFKKWTEDPNQFIAMCSLSQFPRVLGCGRRQFILPERTDNHDTRKTLVLDMDETLVHCFFQYKENASWDWNFTLQNGNNMLSVYCSIRPYLQEFLAAASKMYEIVVFTASQERYASKVLDLIDPVGYIQHRLFQQHCTAVQGMFIKDLSLLGRPLSQIVIIDNSLVSFAFQPSNGIPCDTWLGTQRDDCELLHLVPILQQLYAATDVRVKLSEIYYLDRFLYELHRTFVENDEFVWRAGQAEESSFTGHDSTWCI